MIEEALDRISPLIPVEDIFIATNTLLVEAIRKCLPNVPQSNIIPEPAKQNTAPCLALAAAYISARYPDEEISIAVLTTDQNIFPNDKFLDCVRTALDFAEKNKQLIIIGIPPSKPDTGFGYIETEKPFTKNNNIEIQSVIRFREKPNVEQAQSYIDTERFTWNSGMFF
jgi:mannose-1-phosphate guanylyltransferase